MNVGRFKRNHIPEVVSWSKDEADLIQWAGTVFSWPLTQTQFRRHLEAAQGEHPTLYPFGLYQGARILGYCELSDYQKRFQAARITRVIIHPKKRRQGLGQRMLRAVMEHGFCKMGMNRIALGVFDFNQTAIRCYETMGFIREGTLREPVKVGQEFWNCHLMSILRKEWEQNLETR